MNLQPAHRQANPTPVVFSQLKMIYIITRISLTYMVECNGIIYSDINVMYHLYIVHTNEITNNGYYSKEQVMQPVCCKVSLALTT